MATEYYVDYIGVWEGANTTFTLPVNYLTSDVTKFEIELAIQPSSVYDINTLFATNVIGDAKILSTPNNEKILGVRNYWETFTLGVSSMPFEFEWRAPKNEYSNILIKFENNIATLFVNGVEIESKEKTDSRTGNILFLPNFYGEIYKMTVHINEELVLDLIPFAIYYSKIDVDTGMYDRLTSHLYVSETDTQYYVGAAKRCKINATSDCPLGVWKSEDSVIYGDSVTLIARESHSYRFVEWSDGDTNATRTIQEVKDDINIHAICQRINESKSERFYGMIKYANDLTGAPKGVCRVSVESDSVIRRDLLVSAKSSFSVTQLPDNVENGDIFLVYDSKANLYYEGKITSFGKSQVTCTQMVSLISGAWKFSPPTSYLETYVRNEINKLISGVTGSYQDPVIHNKYSNFNVIVNQGSETSTMLMEENAVEDWEDFIYKIYSQHNVIVTISLPFVGPGLIYISKGIERESPTIIADNAQCILSISPTVEVEDYNKLVIYSSDGTYRASYAVTEGLNPEIVKLDTITDPSKINRFIETKTKVVLSDEDENSLATSNLTAKMYNHKLSVTMLANNPLYDWRKLELGENVKIFNGLDYYSTVFTGYEITIPKGGDLYSVTLTFGKVRTALTDKLVKSGKY